MNLTNETAVRVVFYEGADSHPFPPSDVFLAMQSLLTHGFGVTRVTGLGVPPVTTDSRHLVVGRFGENLPAQAQDAAGRPLRFQEISDLDANQVVAIAEAPPTLEAALKMAFDKAAIYFPFTDLLLPDPYGAISAGATLAFVVGPSTIVGGVKTDMVVWASNDVFLQIWIGADDKLPRRIRAQFSADPKRLRHDLELSNWQLDGTIPAETFSTAKARAGQPMTFAAPGRKVPIGAKPLGIGGAAPTRPKGTQ